MYERMKVENEYELPSLKVGRKTKKELEAYSAFPRIKWANELTDGITNEQTDDPTDEQTDEQCVP